MLKLRRIAKLRRLRLGTFLTIMGRCLILLNDELRTSKATAGFIFQEKPEVLKRKLSWKL